MKKLLRNCRRTIFILTIIVVLEFIGMCSLRHDLKNHECEVPAVAVEAVKEEPEPALQSLGQFKITAYCPCVKCCGKSDGITATGSKATEGRTIAVDPKVIPYGTEVVVDGHTYIAEDCGGAIKQKKLDIFFDSHQEALNFGVQYKEVFVKG